MRTTAIVLAAFTVLGIPTIAQETRPVPKDSMRVVIPGCTRGYIFTAGPRTVEAAGSMDVPEGTHFRMNGPKKLINDIKAHEGSMVAITGLVKKGQFRPDGVSIGGGVRVSPGTPPTAGGMPASPAAGQMMIDVEGWRPLPGSCPAR